MTNRTFQLDVLKNESTCVFCLSWGEGERRFATVPYPAVLIQSYTDWQQVYLQFYRSKRGRKEAGGVETMTQTLDSRLEEKRATLLDQFNTWLRDGALTEIREAIAQSAQPSKRGKQHQTPIDLLLACQPLELARLPWEQWSLVDPSERNANRFRLLRTRLNSDYRQPLVPPQKRQKVRILVIIGEDGDGGIDFRHDFEVIQKQLSSVADLKPVGWTSGQNVTSLKKQIAAAIADPLGWDVLFFAGHSNETKLTGGELAIAPDVSLQLSEIQSELETAISRGLQFAFFNSCSGLNIADSLINLGLNQVAVMREPIANTIAQKLLVKFLEHLAQYQDVQDALQAACEYLKSSAERFDYPSAYLVPSLYCQPQSALFRIQRKGWRQTWELWRPTLPEAVVVGGIAVLCLMYPIQDFLMQRRLLAEAVYRNVTGQIQSGKTPPILLVTIDKASARQIDAYKTERIDRTYLARLIHQAVNLKPTVIGVDYFLDKRTYKEDDKALSMAIQDAVQQHNTRFIFGSREDSIEGEVGITPEIAPLNRLMQGRINFTPWYVELPSANTDCVKSCPFAYLLALTHAATEAFPANTLPQARLQGSVSLRTQLVHKIQQLSTTNQKLMFVKHAQLLPLTQSSKALNDIYQYLDQRWLQPIIDFSIPPEDVYRRIPAKDFLTSESIASNSHKFKQQIVLIIPYAYEEAGVTTGSDNFQAPLATIYWREKQSQNQIRRSDEILPGGEAHAYVVHHLLSQRLVKPIPDLWMIGVGVLLGKGLALLLSSKSRYESRKWLVLLVVATGAYGLAGLQVFVSGAILLPYFFPLVVFWIYLVPTLRRALYERL